MTKVNNVVTKEEEQKKKDKEKFDNSVKSIKNKFNDVYSAMQSASNLINESFIINGEKVDINKINNIMGSIK